MYQRIFVPLDNSPVSALALKEACTLAKVLTSRLLIATVVDLRGAVHSSAGIIETPVLAEKAHQDNEKELLSQALRQAQAQHVVAQTVLLENKDGSNVPSLLLKQAKAWDADLIVMGTHGRTGLMHLMMGSVAEGILRNSPIPLLLIKQSAHS